MTSSNVSFVYPKTKDLKPSGYVIAVYVQEGRIFTGYSLCSAHDQYNKKVGRQIAYDRAVDAHKRWLASCKKRRAAAPVKKAKQKKTKKVVKKKGKNAKTLRRLGR